ncbi:MAG TPA: hypothetical protein VGO86_00045, partial [Candidatus Dormibacteraeota bacterium]
LPPLPAALPPGARVTRMVDPPMPIEVELDDESRPRHIEGMPLVGPVRPVLRWIVEVDWWSQPVSREYWRVLLLDRLLCEIYRDREADTWFVERVYD